MERKCDYGCGQKALFYSKRTKVWRCSKHHSQCPVQKMRNSKNQSNQATIEKRKKTIIERYGVEHQMHIPIIKQKIEQTCLQRYGTKNPAQNKSVNEKRRKTSILKYGAEFFNTKDFKDKRLHSLVEKFGVEHPMLADAVKKKFKQTCVDKYGVENPGQTQQSIKKASLNKSSKTRLKMKNTWANKTHEEKQEIIDKREKTTGYRTPFAKPENRCRTSVSKKETKWLDSFGLPNLLRQYLIKELQISVDGYDPTTNTVYLFHGDFWHGNPKTTKPHETNPRTKKTFAQLYEETCKYESKLKESGYNIIAIWESDYDTLQH